MGRKVVVVVVVVVFSFNVLSFLPYPSNLNTITQNIHIMFSCNYGSIFDFSLFFKLLLSF